MKNTTNINTLLIRAVLCVVKQEWAMITLLILLTLIDYSIACCHPIHCDSHLQFNLLPLLYSMFLVELAIGF